MLILSAAACTSQSPATTAGEASPAVSFIPVPATPTPTASAVAASSAPTATLPRPVVPITGARVLSAVVARGVDAAGDPMGETATFARASDQRIVLVVKIADGTTATTVGYRRYFSGVFVDGKNMHPARDGTGVVTFTWVKTGGSLYPAGAYWVNVLVDGKFAMRVDFSVR